MYVKPQKYDPDTYGKVIEVWESMNGDLYFVTDIEEGSERFGFVRLYSMPQFAEWGYFDMAHLRESYNGQIWKVPERNWKNVNTYEDELLMKVSRFIR